MFWLILWQVIQNSIYLFCFRFLFFVDEVSVRVEGHRKVGVAQSPAYRVDIDAVSKQ